MFFLVHSTFCSFICLRIFLLWPHVWMTVWLALQFWIERVLFFQFLVLSLTSFLKCCYWEVSCQAGSCSFVRNVIPPCSLSFAVLSHPDTCVHIFSLFLWLAALGVLAIWVCSLFFNSGHWIESPLFHQSPFTFFSPFGTLLLFSILLSIFFFFWSLPFPAAFWGSSQSDLPLYQLILQLYPSWYLGHLLCPLF